MSNTDNNWDALMAGVQAPVFVSDMETCMDVMFVAIDSVLHDDNLSDSERCSCAQVLTDIQRDMRTITRNLKQLNEAENG